jgi:hypothetical protein
MKVLPFTTTNTYYLILKKMANLKEIRIEFFCFIYDVHIMMKMVSAAKLKAQMRLQQCALMPKS